MALYDELLERVSEEDIRDRFLHLHKQVAGSEFSVASEASVFFVIFRMRFMYWTRSTVILPVLFAAPPRAAPALTKSSAVSDSGAKIEMSEDSRCWTECWNLAQSRVSSAGWY